MKVAFLSDIHANLPAVRAAMADAKRRGAARFVVAGDLIGGGPHPLEVVRFFMARRAAVIRGNVENMICRLAQDPTAWKKLLKKKKTAHLAWTAPRLGKRELAWLEALPAELEHNYAGTRVLVVHGSPRRDDDYIFVSLTRAALRAKLGDRRPDVLICGHSHVPFVKSVGGVVVINCGSVGRPVDGDPRGSYALGEFQRGRPPKLQIVRFAYPMDELAADLAQRQVPFADADEYRQGIKTKGA